MTGRRVTALVALVVVWLSYALLAIAFADQNASLCHDFGDLAAECFAPQLLFLTAVSAVFIIATLVLTYAAMRTPKGSDKI